MGASHTKVNREPAYRASQGLLVGTLRVDFWKEVAAALHMGKSPPSNCGGAQAKFSLCWGHLTPRRRSQVAETLKPPILPRQVRGVESKLKRHQAGGTSLKGRPTCLHDIGF